MTGSLPQAASGGAAGRGSTQASIAADAVAAL